LQPDTRPQQVTTDLLLIEYSLSSHPVQLPAATIVGRHRPSGDAEGPHAHAGPMAACRRFEGRL